MTQGRRRGARSLAFGGGAPFGLPTADCILRPWALALALTLLVWWPGPWAQGAEAAPDPGLPYVYRQWEHFTVKDKWDIYTEQNAPMEEIWNYGVSARDGKVFLAIWGSGVLEFDLATERWKHYVDPDGEMEIDLYRDDGIPHVITTGVSCVDQTLWASTYFGSCRYDGRHWRGFFTHEGGTPSDFNNAARGRSAHECWYCTDKGIGALMDFESDTWVVYRMDPDTHEGIAEIRRAGQLLQTVRSPRGLPHHYALWADFDGDDVWVGTSKGLGWARGAGYYPRLEPRPSQSAMTKHVSE